MKSDDLHFTHFLPTETTVSKGLVAQAFRHKPVPPLLCAICELVRVCARARVCGREEGKLNAGVIHYDSLLLRGVLSCP